MTQFLPLIGLQTHQIEHLFPSQCQCLRTFDQANVHSITTNCEKSTSNSTINTIKFVLISIMESHKYVISHFNIRL